MMPEPHLSPVPYSPDVETPEADEAEVGQGLTRQMRKVSEKAYEDGGHALRSVHAKSHGILDGDLARERAPGAVRPARRLPGDHAAVDPSARHPARQRFDPKEME